MEYPKVEKNPENAKSELASEKKDVLSSEEHMAEKQTYEEVFRKAKLDGTLPEGVRDAVDYREYMEEHQAHTNEKIKADKEAEAEKVERIGTFEKRVEMNKDFYDKAAFTRAYSIARDNEEYERREGGGEYSGFLMNILYKGVVDNDIENSIIRKVWRDGHGEQILVEKDFVMEKSDEKNFSTIYERSDVGLFGDRYEMSDSDSEAMKHAREMMDTTEYEKSFDKFLNKDPKSITRYDIEDIEKEIYDLNSRSGSAIFSFGKDEWSALRKKDAIIPTLESRLHLEEQILLIKKKISEIIAQVTEREYQKEADSIQGRRVIMRLEQNL